MDDAGTPSQKSHAGISATSTVDRSKAYESKNSKVAESDSLFQNSLGLLSCINDDSKSSIENENFLLEDLSRKRSLANSVLARASQVCAIPSKLFQPDMPSQTINGLADESTISESDLIKTPNNMSTPKCSKLNSRPRMSLLSESISQISEMLDCNSIESVVEDFLKMSRDTTKTTFIPAEAASSKLMADELSWRKKNDIAVTSLQSNLDEIRNTSSVSVGEFFQAKSDSISDFKIKSPTGHKPVPLIDLSQLSGNFELTPEAEISQSIKEPGLPFKKSLSISTIQQILADNEHSPLTAIKKLENKKPLQQLENKKSIPQENNTHSIKSTKYDDKLSMLPSSNSSYSTLFTENHAINAMSNSDKENRPLVTEPLGKKSSINTNISNELPSSRVSSCLTSLSNGKLPIHSTKNELVWGCVKVDKCVTKEFLLRNSSPKSLRIQCTLSTYDFKIRKESRSDAELLSTCKFVLHGNESKSFYVSFAPTKIGAAVDELSFSPLDSNLVQTKKQAIRLFGYGGYANAEFQNPIRDNTGKMWLSFGKIDNRLSLDKSIVVSNSGNIPLFVYIKVQNKYSLTSCSFKIDPEIFVLIPGEEKTVELSYTPNTKDIKVLKQALNAIEATDVGKLEIISGAEVNRARLRRLCRKCLEKGIPLDNMCRLLSERIQAETIPTDIKKFQETTAALSDILETFQHHEVILTIEQDPNQTLIGDFTENSVNFQSLCCDETDLGNITKVSQKCFGLEPSTIIFSPPNKVEDCLYLSSDAPAAVGYEVTISPQGLEIFPSKGVVLPGETEIIRIKCNDNLCNQNFKVYVYLESDVHEVDFKVLNIRNSNLFLG